MKHPIQMKPGYKVYNGYLFNFSNCVLVDNYDKINSVESFCIDYKDLQDYKDIYSIGVWKIKSLNE